MTDAQKTTMVQTLCDNDALATDALVAVYLNIASSVILRRMYPFGIPDGASIPAQYDILQCQLAARYFLRRGAEGEIAHKENGVDRTYQSVNDEDLLREVIQIAMVG